MADSRRRTQKRKKDDDSSKNMLSVLLIMYPLSDIYNSKWQIQDSICENEKKKHDTMGKNMYSEVFRVADN